MEVEKKRSKGGFLNLFDWNGKSRKKLFSNNSDLPGMFVFLDGILFSRFMIMLLILMCMHYDV